MIHGRSRGGLGPLGAAGVLVSPIALPLLRASQSGARGDHEGNESRSRPGCRADRLGPGARSRPQAHARMGRAQGDARRAPPVVPGRGGRDSGAGPQRGARAQHGGGRELQRRLGRHGQARQRPRRAQAPVPHRRLRLRGHRVEGGRRGAPLEGGRRGRSALQPDVRRMPVVQRLRPDGLREPEDLGLRDAVRQLCPVHPRAIAAADAQGAEHDVGRVGELRARSLHGLPDADRSRCGRARRYSCGAAPGASAPLPVSSRG